MSRMVHVAHMADAKNAHKILLRISDGWGISDCLYVNGCTYNIKLQLREVGYQSVGWMEFTQYTGQIHLQN
jgi:hypothetical protein